MAIDFSRPIHADIPNFGQRECRCLGGPVELRAGPRYVLYFEKTNWDDAYIGNCDSDGRIGNPFGTNISDFGTVTNK